MRAATDSLFPLLVAIVLWVVVPFQFFRTKSVANYGPSVWLAHDSFQIVGTALGAGSSAAQKKDYLTALEADKIRDAETTSERIKLFVSFAADRLKKIQYEMSHPGTDRRRAERLNDLLNAYAGCLDDAAERIDLALEKQEDIRDAVKQLKRKAKEFLPYLEKLAESSPALPDIKEDLGDAIDATKAALKDVERAEKEMVPPPVRRKP